MGSYKAVPIKLIALCVIVLLLIVIPIVVSNSYFTYLLVIIVFGIIMATTFRLVMTVGEVNFGYAAFVAIGAYCTGLLTVRAGLNFWEALPLSGLLGAVAGVMLGLPALRLRGLYFFLVTFAFGSIAVIIIQGWPFLGGNYGISNIPLPPLISGTTSFYYLALAFMLIIIAVLYRLDITRFGRCCRAIKSDYRLAESLGIKVLKYKLSAFVISCFFAAIAGSLFASFYGSIGSQSFGIDRTVQVMTFVVVGGSGSLTGAILGAVFLSLVSEIFKPYAAYSMLGFGIILALVIRLLPGGLISTPALIRSIGDKRRRTLGKPRIQSGETVK